MIDHLYGKPLIGAKKVSELTGLSSPSSYKLIYDLENLRILKEITGGKRKKMYLFDDYLKLFQR